MTGCLFDRVELNGKKGWISGFTGKSCYVKDADDQYLSTSPKYKQVSLSKTQNSASLWQLDHRSKENFREGVMAQRAILLSSRSLNCRGFSLIVLNNHYLFTPLIYLNYKGVFIYEET